MMRIAICDDEAPTRTYLASLIRAQDRPCEVVEYASAGTVSQTTGELTCSFWTLS